MSKSLSNAQLEQLRRNAKRLARQEAIPLHQAQDRLAQQHGFSNWALLIRHTPTQEATKARPASRSDSRRRYYFHGDQIEDNTGLYFCALCDLSFPLEHVTTEHGTRSVERYLRELNNVDSLPTEWHRLYHRPPHPVNALDEAVQGVQAEAARREASRSEFHRWIVTQVSRQDWVGGLAQDIKGDKGFPVEETSLGELIDYLKRKSAVKEALTALRQAYAEFSAPR